MKDYGYEFSTDRSALPLFANTITREGGDSLKTYPRYFSRHVQKQNGRPGRAWKSNDFFVPEAFQDTLNVPFITSSELTLGLLSEYTGKNIRLLDSFPSKKHFERTKLRLTTTKPINLKILFTFKLNDLHLKAKFMVDKKLSVQLYTLFRSIYLNDY